VAGGKLDTQVYQEAYYRAITFLVPAVKTATYANRAWGVGNGFSLEELRRFATYYESESKPALQECQGSALIAQARDR